MPADTKAKKSSMSLFTMSMITVAAVLSLRNLPSMADYGWAVVFYILAACICFFIPSALVAAELASTYPENGGVFQWVKQAFGPKWGFVAIFMQWVENLPWFPAALTFVASAIAYIFDPELATNRWFVYIVMLIAMWCATFLNFRGMKLSAFLSSSGVLAGTVVPGIVIIIMVAVYLLAGNPVRINFNDGLAMIPNLDSSTQLMLLVGMMVALAGMEMSAVHVTEMDNPTVKFPRAIFLASIVIIFLSVLGSLAIALVVPTRQLSFAAGVCQTFDDIFTALNCRWLTPVMCFLLAYGALTMVVTWILGPSKGLLEVAKEGYMPAFWQKRNRFEMPTRILIFQAVASSILGSVILFMPTISNAFWLMSALTGQLYMVMYLFMFAAAIKLRYSQPDKVRPYKIPGGKAGMWVIAGIAWLTSLLSIAVGFIPPSNVTAKGTAWTVGYIVFLAAGILIFVGIPIVIYRFFRPDATSAKNE